jgi:MFS transporter, NNP family, nitrate/nitrite transporter
VLALAFFGVGLDAVGLSWQASQARIVPVTVFCLTMAAFLGLGNGAVFARAPVLPAVEGRGDRDRGRGQRARRLLPPLVMGVIKDATGGFALGFVFLVAFAWLCAEEG